METLIISLPVELKDFLNAQIAKGEYKSHSDYVQQNLSKTMQQAELVNESDDFPIDPNLLKVFSQQSIK